MKDDRFSADVLSLNETVRAAVQSAGGAFVDIWAGFVDDKNAYVASGPDVDGKVTRLRASNGVNFTEAGGRKAAHFAEAELKPLEGDPLVSRALRDGIAPPARPGRADEFRWPVR